MLELWGLRCQHRQVHTYTHTPIHIHIHTCTLIRTPMHPYTIHPYTYTYTYTHTHTHTHVHRLWVSLYASVLWQDQWGWLYGATPAMVWYDTTKFRPTCWQRLYQHNSLLQTPQPGVRPGVRAVYCKTKDLSGAALKDASKQSSDRYTCEVYFSRVKDKCVLLKGECTHHHWGFLDTAWSIGHYAANLQRPLRCPRNFDKLKSQYIELKNKKFVLISIVH